MNANELADELESILDVKVTPWDWETKSMQKATTMLRQLQADVEIQKQLKQEMHDFHTAAMKEAFKLLGIEHDEYRFKHVASAIVELQDGVKAHEEVHEDHNRLVRELDVLLNGNGAAKQASLCDIVAQVKSEKWTLVRAQ